MFKVPDITTNPVANATQDLYELLALAFREDRAMEGVPKFEALVTKGDAELVVCAADMFPAQILDHIALLCEYFKVPLSVVPSQVELGQACGFDYPVSIVTKYRDDRDVNAETADTPI
ncbi:hypothetical protein LY78DRAFT_649151 [Colletotrichum sublineola]|nr:hypothetical protein LY78DRAFT_649151 [Colletotrichum sublineola]